MMLVAKHFLNIGNSRTAKNGRKWFLKNLKRRLRAVKWFVIHVSKLGKVKFNSYKRFCSYVDLLGDNLSRIWVAMEG